jgi:hypothetical protein
MMLSLGKKPQAKIFADKPVCPERIVVVLPRVDKDNVKILPASLDGFGKPYDFRPRADNDHQFDFFHAHTSPKNVSGLPLSKSLNCLSLQSYAPCWD